MSATTRLWLSECCAAETHLDMHDPFERLCSKCHKLNVEFEGELKVVSRVCWHNWQCSHLGKIGTAA